jgi:AcrR family transcriptional regulator
MSIHSLFNTRIRDGLVMAPRSATKPRKSAVQDRSRATVAALVEATARILVREGFDKASTNRIAEVAGVSVGSLYQYFPSKEALVVAVAERHRRDIMEVVSGSAAEVMSLPLQEGIPKLVSVAIDAHRVDPVLHRVLAEQIPRTGALEDVGGVNYEAHDLFRSYLQRRRHELSVADVDLAAFVCATSIEALAHNAVLHHAEMFRDGAARRLIDQTSALILGYLTASAAIGR